jgi:hypothetical protein
MDSSDTRAIGFLLQDRKFLAKVEAERLRQKLLLMDYLRQKNVLGNPACALVDIGWRGSIVAALATTCSRESDYLPLNAYYLGYWHEQGCQIAPGCSITGILSDIGRPQNVREAASYYVGHLLEAVCRAEHGTVVAYRKNADGVVLPVLAGDSEQRQAELTSEQLRSPIRQGILDYIDANAASLKLAATDPEKLRAEVQSRLLRLAFFPTKDEIAAAGRLRHTEGHAEQWSRPLIDDLRPSPFRNPRQWLAGLSSPWRSGYVMATGGRMLALVFISLEMLLIALPTSCRSHLRSFALTLSRRT